MDDALQPFCWRVEQSAVLRVAEILRDPNPIHFDQQAAAAVGLAGPINQGPANLAYAVNMLEAAYPGSRLLSIDSRYLANVLVGEEARAEGRETERNGELVTCEFRVTNGAGRDAVVGTATLKLPVART